MFDLVIRGVTVYDGSGRPGTAADVAVRDGRIAEVGRVSTAVMGEEASLRAQPTEAELARMRELLRDDRPHHTAPAPTAPPRLVRGGEQTIPSPQPSPARGEGA
jgi:N-acyl-D-aspartate/D-glutamate deacylase